MIIRRFREKDSQEVYRLVSKVFNEFVAPEFTQKATRKWLKEQAPKEQIKRAKTRDVYIAIISGKIVGMVEGKMIKKGGNSRVSRLFVDKKYHGKSIGRNLMDKIEKLYKKRGIKKMIVHSSLYAKDFYEKMGYRKTTRLVKKEGMIYQPMKKVLK